MRLVLRSWMKMGMYVSAFSLRLSENCLATPTATSKEQRWLWNLRIDLILGSITCKYDFYWSVPLSWLDLESRDSCSMCLGAQLSSSKSNTDFEIIKVRYQNHRWGAQIWGKDQKLPVILRRPSYFRSSCSLFWIWLWDLRHVLRAFNLQIWFKAHDSFSNKQHWLRNRIAAAPVASNNPLGYKFPGPHVACFWPWETQPNITKLEVSKRSQAKNWSSDVFLWGMVLVVWSIIGRVILVAAGRRIGLNPWNENPASRWVISMAINGRKYSLEKAMSFYSVMGTESVYVMVPPSSFDLYLYHHSV